MYNFPIEHEGQTYWRSRSVAVVGFVYCKDRNGNWCVLLEKRGDGAPNEKGKWCVVCGFLDFNEDGQHAVARECLEETGVKINPVDFIFNSVKFDEDGEQNVGIRYTCMLKDYIDYHPLSAALNEKDETSDIKWVPLKDVRSMSPKDFAFGHYELIFEMFLTQKA